MDPATEAATNTPHRPDRLDPLAPVTRAELHAELLVLRTELMGEIASLRTEIAGVRTEVERMGRLMIMWSVGTMIALVAAVSWLGALRA